LGPGQARSPNGASRAYFFRAQHPAAAPSPIDARLFMLGAMHILVVEDNSDIAANIGDYLADKGHVVDFAGDGVTGLHLAGREDFDAIVLDLTLPGMDGLELCRRLRQDARKMTPVLMLTARDALEQKLVGFESGADDYMVKPFALQELEARLSVLSRRSRGPKSRILKVADLEYNLDTLIVTRP
jgi:DNA-binding response OmpR family regulator